MRTRTYSQYCGLACALELVGERWALLIVRDLVLGPKRFTDLRLGLPGAKTMREPRPEDTLNADSLLLGLRAIFRPEAAGGLKATYELRLGELVAHARIDRGALEVGEGPLDDPDLVLETDFAFRAVLTGELDPDEAVESGHLRLEGDRALLEPFVEAFRIPPVPVTAR